MMNYLIIDNIIKNALNEDITSEDITSNSTIPVNAQSTVQLISKDYGVIVGLEIFSRVFTILGNVQVDLNIHDGAKVTPKEVVATLRGNTRNILTGERTALNLLQRMSGVATLTNKYVEAVKGTNAIIVDTRKTTPGLRVLEKYAVSLGGGSNHRYNLSDGVLIKDNHISAAGGIKEAINAVKKNVSFTKKIEIEVESIESLKEALEAGADIIMLDNMSTDMMKMAVRIVNKRALLEASGNVSLNSVHNIALTGIDLISVGNLTHSAPILDLSMKNLKVL